MAALAAAKHSRNGRNGMEQVEVVVATVPSLAVARPSAADAARVSTRLYMQTALLKDHMPAGLTDLESVPTLRAQIEENDYEERLAEYVRA